MRVFISYSSLDKNFADKLKEKLESWKHTTWMDVYNIPKGESWPREIDKGLDACDVFVVVMSKAAFDSENVLSECLSAQSKHKTLIPLRIENYNQSIIPTILVLMQHIDFVANQEAGFSELKKILHEESDKPLSELLDLAGIKPWPQIAELIENSDRDVIAVDGVVSLIYSPGYKGWHPDKIEIEMLPESDYKNTLPLNWEKLNDEFGLHTLEPNSTNEPKVFLGDYTPDFFAGSPFSLRLGRSSYAHNRALETVLNLNQARMEGNSAYEWTEFKWKSESEWRKVFLNPKGEAVDLRDEYFQDHLDFWEHTPNLIFVIPVVISTDDKVLIPLRSSKVKYYPGHWSISITEQINPDVDKVNNTLFQNVTERAIEEELRCGVKDLKVLSLCREWQTGNIGVVVLSNIDATSSRAAAQWRGAKDVNEARKLAFEDFSDLTAMLNLLRQTQYRDRNFHPHARYSLLFSLLARYGDEAVENGLNKILND